MAINERVHPFLQVSGFLQQIANIFVVLFILAMILFVIGYAVAINGGDLRLIFAFGSGVLSGILAFRLVALSIEAVFDPQHQRFTRFQKWLLFTMSVAVVSVLGPAVWYFPHVHAWFGAVRF